MIMNMMESLIYDELRLLKAESNPRNKEVEHALELIEGYKSMVQEQEFRVAETMKVDFFNYLATRMENWYESFS